MKQKKYSIIGYTYGDSGNIPGTNEGPRVLRHFFKLEQRLKNLGHNISDLGDTYVEDYEQVARVVKKSLSAKEKNINNIIPAIVACKKLSEKTKQALDNNSIPIVIGGDHSLSIASTAAISNHYAKQKKNIGLIWIDAHGDINTPETSPSNNLFGMTIACLLGFLKGQVTSFQEKSPSIEVENLVYIGLRDLDEGEKRTIKEKNISAFSIKDIDIQGMAAIAKEAIAIASKNTCGYVVSFDLDSCDPIYAPGTGTPVRGGLTYREAHLLLELIADDDKMLGFEIVELNPLLDKDFTTAQVAVSLIESVLGKSIK